MSEHAAPFDTERLLEFLERLPPARNWWVAFSGGADSSALLHALWLLRGRLRAPIRVLHVDHGLQPASADWAEHCRQFCEQRKLPLVCHRIEIPADAGQGIEAEARQARYAVAERLLLEGDVLLTGHHADDQAETLLLNLMRGSGVQGLAGMPGSRPLGRGLLARPLLDFSGPALRAFLDRHGVSWIEDNSNRDPAYDRNFVRLELLPAMARRWPGASRNVAVSAHLSRLASDFVEWSAGRLVQAAELAPGVLDYRQLLDTLPPGAPEEILGLPLRHWLNAQGAPSIPRARLREFLAQLNSGAGLAAWSGWLLHAYGGCLWLQREAGIASCPECTWDTAETLGLGRGLGRILLDGSAKAPRPQLQVSARRGGEKIACLPGRHHKSVKRVLQEAGVPPWLRTSIPLLWHGKEIVAVGDMTLSSAWGEQLKSMGLELRWEPDDPVLQFVRRRHLAVPG